MENSRTKILERLRAAQLSLSSVEPASDYIPVVPTKDMSAQELLNQFASQAKQLESFIHQPGSADEALQIILDIIGGESTVISWDFDHIPLDGLAEAFRKAGIKAVTTPEAAARVGITGVDAALAATGSLILGTGEGKPRTASLLPMVHIAVFHPNQILPDLEIWVEHQRAIGVDAFRQTSSVMIISGPSRTADIAMQLILGMHGPGVLHLIILND